MMLTTLPQRSTLTAAAVALGLCALLSTAQAQTAAPAKKPAAKPAGPANPAATARSTAKAQQLAQDTVEQVNAAQMDVAARVLNGVAECEFNQKVSVEPIAGKPAHFMVVHGKGRYTMVPQETTTGAVRLEDKKAGMVWLQIPAKSMLMNAKIGQRVADNCTQAEQRAAVTAVQQATAASAAPTAAVPGAAPAAAAAASAPASAAQ